MSKHTPGPLCRDASGAVKCSLCLAAEERVRAAAPELLEVLKALLAEYEEAMHAEYDFPNDPWSAEGRGAKTAVRARAVIAKAEGES